ncbi:MAG: phosphatidate cytidylyltransferase [Lachnospiraceae bacterium]|nr:phosphatidate cytidylyltransferase [Lachnospiraceae bacterium]
MKSFWIRLRSSIIIMAVAITSLVLGGYVLWGVLGIISLIGLFELYRVVSMQRSVQGWIGYVAAVAYYILILLQLLDIKVFFAFLIGFFLILLISYVLCFPKVHFNKITAVFFGVFYIAVMLSFIYQIRILPSGAYLVWLIFIGSWGSDTCAYCVGMLLGKHKLKGGLHELSPNKSIEGCIGGVIGAALIGVIYGAIFTEHLQLVLHPVLGCALLGGCSAVLSQFGDLAASAIKRDHQIKDYGKLIPGHGGIVDRFDSIIFTAPIVYLLVTFLVK